MVTKICKTYFIFPTNIMNLITVHVVTFHNMLDYVQANAVGCVLQNGSLGLCREAQPLFNATSAQQSNFSGQSATWATVINKRVADGSNFTDILLLCSTLQYNHFVETKKRGKRRNQRT